MIVSFDLTGVLCLILIPTVTVYLCRLAWEFAYLTRGNLLFKMNTKYRDENIRLVKELHQLIEENEDLKRKLEL